MYSGKTRAPDALLPCSISWATNEYATASTPEEYGDSTTYTGPGESKGDFESRLNLYFRAEKRPKTILGLKWLNGVLLQQPAGAEVVLET